MLQRRGVKKIRADLLRLVASDGKVWLTKGIVKRFAGKDAHYATTEEGDTMVSVELDDGTPVWCLWQCPLAGKNLGIWTLPEEGLEVPVAVPGGELEGDPIAWPGLAGWTPEDSKEGRTLVMGNEVWAYDGEGEPVSLATKADVEALRDALNGHEHTYIAPGTGGSAAQTTGNPSVPAPTGTKVLKAR